jgi:hypothetical protein
MIQMIVPGLTVLFLPIVLTLVPNPMVAKLLTKVTRKMNYHRVL